MFALFLVFFFSCILLVEYSKNSDSFRVVPRSVCLSRSLFVSFLRTVLNYFHYTCDRFIYADPYSRVQPNTNTLRQTIGTDILAFVLWQSIRWLSHFWILKWCVFIYRFDTKFSIYILAEIFFIISFLTKTSF